MSEDWFIATTGGEYAAWDEGSFTRVLGKERAAIELKKHWDDWIKETDFDIMRRGGINTVRFVIPPFFFFLPPFLPSSFYPSLLVSR